MLSCKVSSNNIIISPDNLDVIKLDNINLGKDFNFFSTRKLKKRAEFIFKFTTEFDFNEAIISFSPKISKNSTIFYFIECNKKRYFLGSFSILKSFSFSKEDEDLLIDVDVVKFKKKLKTFDVGSIIIAESDVSIKLINIVLTNTKKKTPYRRFLPPKEINLSVRKMSQMVFQVDYNQSICSPTSVAMVLDYYGIKADTLKIADYVYDNSLKIYGNWIFNTSYASSLGLYAFVARLNSYKELYEILKEGVPVIASITYDTDELKGSPIKKTKGHLLVIKGIDKDGRVIVNDPAAKDIQSVEIKYDPKEFYKAWFLNKYGTAYILVDEKRIKNVINVFEKTEERE